MIIRTQIKKWWKDIFVCYELDFDGSKLVILIIQNWFYPNSNILFGNLQTNFFKRNASIMISNKIKSINAYKAKIYFFKLDLYNKNLKCMYYLLKLRTWNLMNFVK